MNVRKLYTLLVAGLMVFLLVILGNIISVGERLDQIHSGLAYFFYFLLFFLLNVGVLYPLYRILKSSTLDLSILYEDDGQVRSKEIRQLAEKFKNESDLNEDQKQVLQETVRVEQITTTKNLLKQYVDERFTQMDEAIFAKAQLVFVATAVSQSGRIDALTSLVFNIQLVTQLIKILGFRPTYYQLAKLYLNVFLTALLVESIDDLFDAENGILAGTLSPLLKGIPFIKEIANSTLDGAFSAFLTLRIGYITKTYLKGEDKMFSRKGIRKSARLFAKQSISSVVKKAVLNLKFNSNKKVKVS
ncbi:DUF697 domain-containing protein [Sediminitomix flava]|uniref:Uncharacterized protein DUF697 n=1 Tax=Sediminitomix flava TaxID=379075 RepID=A0A315Z6C4_SEDFL|nr:DUF697 domain-containing protein [Sediminitomix flava]PWJ39417.1 uncharacterized protein DUF697 [Sediminitomix flava]